MQQATDLVNAALLQLLNSAAAAASAGGSSSSSAATAASNTWFTWVQHLCDELCRLLSNYWPALQQKSSRSSSSSALDDDIMHTGIRCTSHNSSAPAGSIQVTQLHQCPLLNISICAASVSAAHQAQVALLLNGSSSSSMDGHVSASAAGAAVSSSGLLVLVYNSLGWPRRELVTVPVVKGHYVVEGEQTNYSPSAQLHAMSLFGKVALGLAIHHYYCYDCHTFSLVLPSATTFCRCCLQMLMEMKCPVSCCQSANTPNTYSSSWQQQGY